MVTQNLPRVQGTECSVSVQCAVCSVQPSPGARLLADRQCVGLSLNKRHHSILNAGEHGVAVLALALIQLETGQLGPPHLLVTEGVDSPVLGGHTVEGSCHLPVGCRVEHTAGHLVHYLQGGNKQGMPY